MNEPAFAESYGAASPCAPDFQLRPAGATTESGRAVPIKPLKNPGKRAFPGFYQFFERSAPVGCNRLLIRVIQLSSEASPEVGDFPDFPKSSGYMGWGGGSFMEIKGEPVIL